MERRISRFRVWIQEMGKHMMFREPSCMLFYPCNIFYCIAEEYSLIRGCRHGWPMRLTFSAAFLLGPKAKVGLCQGLVLCITLNSQPSLRQNSIPCSYLNLLLVSASLSPSSTCFSVCHSTLQNAGMAVNLNLKQS